MPHLITDITLNALRHAGAMGERRPFFGPYEPEPLWDGPITLLPASPSDETESPEWWGHPDLWEPLEVEAIDPSHLLESRQPLDTIPHLEELRPHWVPDPREDDRGVERYGWYRSFHWDPAHDWGIYVRDWALYEIAARVFTPLRCAPGSAHDLFPDLVKALRLLLLHEVFHFVVDMAAANVELGVARRAAAGPASRIWIPYFEQVYVGGKGPGRELEESLANAYCFERLRPKGRARTFMRTQPPGYRDFEQHLGPAFDQGLRELASQLLDPGAPASGVGPMEALFSRENPWELIRSVPIHLVLEIHDPRFALGFIASIPLAEQSEGPLLAEDLRNRPDLIPHVDKARQQLANSTRYGSLNFEKLRKVAPPMYSVRLTRKDRLLLQPQPPGRWTLLRAGKHDDMYRFANA